MAETPPRPPAATSSVPATRPPTAVEQATHAAYNTPADPAPMAEEQFMPTCMVWATFLGLGLFIGYMLLWVVGHLGG